MRLLLDTHTLLWWLEDSPQLGTGARDAVARDENQVYLSVASVWEMAIKASLGKLALSRDLAQVAGEELVRNAINLLPIRTEHCVAVARLPFHHRDPFDRMLVSQALCDDLVIVSRDEGLDAYPVRRIW